MLVTTAHTGTSPRTYARIVGALYILIAFVGPFAFFMGRVGVVTPGDPSATVHTLLASESTYRLGMVAESIIVMVEILVSAILYVLFIPVNKPLSLASAFARFAQTILQAVNLFTAVPALLVLGGLGYLSAFEPEQVNAIVQIFADVNAFMILIWGLIFGFHLLLLGTLVYQSGFLPKVLGILLLIGGVGYLAQSYGHLLVPQYDGLLATVVIIMSIPGEIGFAIWLLWKGVDEEKWYARAAETAYVPS
jgi:hypothetical protein